MTDKCKTLSSFWGQPCHHFDDEHGGACHHFGDGLSSFWGRFEQFTASYCHHFDDILNNHTPSKQNRLQVSALINAEQAGRPVDPKYRTDGQPAWLRLVERLSMVPMPANLFGRGIGGSTVLLSLPSPEKKSGEKSW